MLEKITRRSEYQSVYEPDVFRPFLEDVNANAAGLHDKILSEILEPWPKKSLPRGYRVDKFFPNVGQSVYTELRILRDREILVFWS